MKVAPILAVIGNKCIVSTYFLRLFNLFKILGDLEYQRAVSIDRINKFVKELNLLNYIVSAKTGESVSRNIPYKIKKK